MRNTGGANTIPVPAGSTWSNAELHAAMVAHFTTWADVPQWKVWLLHARLHDMGPGLLGIMFDQQGKQRQGCAVFYAGVGGAAPADLREQLYTCVHELGHCFNLFHSFHKKYMDPPLPNRLKALSWMNYPWKFPGGPSAFWSNFPFVFDTLETVHLRHAYRNNVIMGANPFGKGAALERGALSDLLAPEEDHSGLKLTLSAPQSVPLGTPVRVLVQLESTDGRAKHASPLLANGHPALPGDPKFGVVKLGIQGPNGRIADYEHPIHHCISAEPVLLTAGEPQAPPASALVSYDRRLGQVFDQPGTYRLLAAYPAVDGSTVVSNVATLAVRPPMTASDADAAELMLQDDVGLLLALDGSDSETLGAANAAIDTVLEEHAEHPAAAHAALAKGTNAAREFKLIQADYSVTVRKPMAKEAASLLKSASSAGAEEGMDPVATLQALSGLAHVQSKEAASATKKRMTTIGEEMNLPPSALNTFLGDDSIA